MRGQTGLLSIWGNFSHNMSCFLTVQWHDSQSVGEGAWAGPGGGDVSARPRASNCTGHSSPAVEPGIVHDRISHLEILFFSSAAVLLWITTSGGTCWRDAKTMCRLSWKWFACCTSRFALHVRAPWCIVLSRTFLGNACAKWEGPPGNFEASGLC